MKKKIKELELKIAELSACQNRIDVFGSLSARLTIVSSNYS